MKVAFLSFSPLLAGVTILLLITPAQGIIFLSAGAVIAFGAIFIGTPCALLVGWGAIEGTSRLPILGWKRAERRKKDFHKKWHDESVIKYQDYLDNLVNDRRYEEVFIEATVKPHRRRRHEFDRPGKWFDNLHIWSKERVQVLNKTKKKKNGIWKQLTCAWWHPTHGLLIGNIKKKNLKFGDINER